MNPDEVKNVKLVYRHFMATEENRSWDELDDFMDKLEYLEDFQLHREADVVYTMHKNGDVGCGVEHPQSECFVSNIIEAVGSILDLYKETHDLHPENKYILQYYLAVNQAGAIRLR